MPTPRKKVTKPKTKAGQTKKKPIQYFIDSVGGKRKITIIVKGGTVQDIVNTACPDIPVVVHDYDTKKDIDNEPNFYSDQYGEEFCRITFN
jgi:hypothetical protein